MLTFKKSCQYVPINYLYYMFQVYVDGTEKTVVLQGLYPLTEYRVEVFSVVGDKSSEPLQGVETTRGFSHDGIFSYIWGPCHFLL